MECRCTHSGASWTDQAIQQLGVAGPHGKASLELVAAQLGPEDNPAPSLTLSVETQHQLPAAAPQGPEQDQHSPDETCAGFAAELPGVTDDNTSRAALTLQLVIHTHHADERALDSGIKASKKAIVKFEQHTLDWEQHQVRIGYDMRHIIKLHLQTSCTCKAFCHMLDGFNF